MAVTVQVVIDAADPGSLAQFWAQATGYVVQEPPEGFDSWPAFLEKMGVPEDQWDKASACVDPEGVGPRLFFQKVPEPKTIKNRVHVDLQPGRGSSPDRRPGVARAEVERLVGIGARVLHEHDEMGEFWIVLADPEGNEFCVS